MSVEIVTPTEEQSAELLTLDERAFASVLDEPGRIEARGRIDLDRFRVAVDATGALVAVAGSYPLELTLPGNAVIPMAGLTWVSVSVTHRRQGILRRLVAAIHADAAARDEPIMGLIASEGAIYGRFGYGASTRRVVTRIDRTRALFRDPTPPTPGSIRLVPTRDALDETAARWDRFRRSSPGEIGRSEPMHRQTTLSSLDRQSVATTALHRDGYASWTVRARWTDGQPDYRLELHDFAAITSHAHADLWKTVLSTDLVSQVHAEFAIGPSDPLPLLLTEPRCVHTVSVTDALWLCPLDLARCFGARDYRVEDRLVLDVDGDLMTIDAAEAAGARATAAASEPADLSLDRDAAGPLLLGGVSATALAAAGRIRANTARALQRADVLFGWEPPAHLRTPF